MTYIKCEQRKNAIANAQDQYIIIIRQKKKVCIEEKCLFHEIITNGKYTKFKILRIIMTKLY